MNAMNAREDSTFSVLPASCGQWYGMTQRVRIFLKAARLFCRSATVHDAVVMDVSQELALAFGGCVVHQVRGKLIVEIFMTQAYEMTVASLPQVRARLVKDEVRNAKCEVQSILTSALVEGAFSLQSPPKRYLPAPGRRPALPEQCAAGGTPAKSATVATRTLGQIPRKARTIPKKQESWNWHSLGKPMPGSSLSQLQNPWKDEFHESLIS